MHPSKFFEECSIRTGIDVVEVYDENLKEKLKNVHPKNFLKTQIALPVYKITISFQTESGNFRKTEKYTVMESGDDDEYIDFWVEMFIRDYNAENPHHKMINPHVDSIIRLGDAVLRLG